MAGDFWYYDIECISIHRMQSSLWYCRVKVNGYTRIGRSIVEGVRRVHAVLDVPFIRSFDERTTR